jgi:hypothetical protein
MLEPSYDNELMRLVNAFQLSQAIHVAATVGIADLLAQGPRSADELAGKTGTNAGALYRLLRALAAAGVFHEDEERRFALSPLGAWLQSDVPAAVAPWARLIGRPNYWQAWGNLLHSVRTGENAFRHVNGAGVWEYREQNAAEGEIFDAAMDAFSRKAGKAIVDAYDFGKFRCMVDVGGGRGTVLATILAANPPLRGVLFDQPHVVAHAESAFRSAVVAERCEIKAGDFFETVPKGGDAYFLKSILHDWPDVEAATILRACRAAIPDHGRLILVEQLIAGPNEGLTGKLSDLNMLVAPGGRERTQEELAELLRSAEFELTAIVPTALHLSIIEGVPV